MKISEKGQAFWLIVVLFFLIGIAILTYHLLAIPFICPAFGWTCNPIPGW